MTAPHPEPAVATHTVRVFNLRLWLPLSLIIASAVMALILIADQQRHYAQDLQRFADHTAHAELLETQRALETVLRRSDGSGKSAEFGAGNVGGLHRWFLSSNMDLCCFRWGCSRVYSPLRRRAARAVPSTCRCGMGP